MTASVDTANLEMLKEVIGDDLKEILQSFIDIAPGALQDIELAIQNKDADSLRLHAHTLKGSSANIGATKLPDLAFALENEGKNGNTEGLDSAFNTVKTETQAVLTFLNTYLTQF